MRGTGLTPLFPISGIPTDLLARDMVAAGLRARLTCIDPRKLPASFAGRDFDETLLADLANLHPDVDPCGERGEFHSFAYDGPMFRRAVPIRGGEVLERDGFVFADLLLDRPRASSGDPIRLRLNSHGRSGLPRDLSAG